ncbi:hypothetical protein ACNKHN_03265 [Shigella flexneri]
MPGEIDPSFLYLSLAIIVGGYGLFKSNVSCLLGELYERTDPRRDGGFRSCMRRVTWAHYRTYRLVFAQEEYSWAMGFGLAVAGYDRGSGHFMWQSSFHTYPRR